ELAAAAVGVACARRGGAVPDRVTAHADLAGAAVGVFGAAIVAEAAGDVSADHPAPPVRFIGALAVLCAAVPGAHAAARRLARQDALARDDLGAMQPVPFASLVTGVGPGGLDRLSPLARRRLAAAARGGQERQRKEESRGVSVQRNTHLH